MEEPVKEEEPRDEEEDRAYREVVRVMETLARRGVELIEPPPSVEKTAPRRLDHPQPCRICRELGVDDDLSEGYFGSALEPKWGEKPHGFLCCVPHAPSLREWYFKEGEKVRARLHLNDGSNEEVG